MNEIKTVIVTGDQAILHKGSKAKIQNTGHGFWVVLEFNGQSTYPATVFLIENRDFKLEPQ